MSKVINGMVFGDTSEDLERKNTQRMRAGMADAKRTDTHDRSEASKSWANFERIRENELTGHLTRTPKKTEPRYANK